MSLSENSFKRISNGEDLSKEELYLQIVEIQKMANGRYKVKLNDQNNFMWGLVQNNCNSIFENNEAISGTVISVKDHIVNNVQGAKMMIMKTWDILQKDCELLGSPVDLPVQKPAGHAGNPAQQNNAFGSGFGGGQARANNPFGGSGGATTGGSGGGAEEFQPVTQLSPFQKSFKIKVRVTRKGDMKTWNNSRGSGKLFSVDLLDEFGGEIQATCFNDAADKFFVVFQEGKVFKISKGRVKVSNKRFTHITNDYSIDLNESSEVEFVGEDTAIKGMVYEFKTLDQIANAADKTFIDVIGVCDDVGDVQTFTSNRTQKELTKRTFRIVDQTQTAVECTLWGETAQRLDASSILNNTVALKAAKVSDYNGKSLSVNAYAINPPGVAESDALLAWFKTDGSSTNFKSMTQRSGGGGGRDEPPISLRDMETKRLGTNPEKPDYFNVVATIMQIPVDMEKRAPWYKAVPDDEGPAYKVTEHPEGGDGWWCEKNQKSYSTYKPRYILRARIADHTACEWINMYNDIAEVIMGKTASDLEALYDNKEEDKFNQCFKSAVNVTWNLRCRAKQQEYQGEQSRRVDALSAKPVDFVQDGNEMYNKITEMLGMKGTAATAC